MEICVRCATRLLQALASLTRPRTPREVATLFGERKCVALGVNPQPRGLICVASGTLLNLGNATLFNMQQYKVTKHLITHR